MLMQVLAFRSVVVTFAFDSPVVTGLCLKVFCCIFWLLGDGGWRYGGTIVGSRTPGWLTHPEILGVSSVRGNEGVQISTFFGCETAVFAGCTPPPVFGQLSEAEG